jgi:hypothetical protein
MPIILATWEVEIARIVVGSQPSKKSMRPHIKQKKKKVGHSGAYLSSQLCGKYK